MKAVGLDSSVVIRLLTGLPEAPAAKAKQYIESLHADNRKALVSDLVVSEAYFVLVHHYSMPAVGAMDLLADFLESGPIVPEPGGSALETLKSVSRHRAGFVDQLIRNHYLAFAEEVATFDADFGKMEKVKLLKN